MGMIEFAMARSAFDPRTTEDITHCVNDVCLREFVFLKKPVVREEDSSSNHYYSIRYDLKDIFVRSGALDIEIHTAKVDNTSARIICSDFDVPFQTRDELADVLGHIFIWNSEDPEDFPDALKVRDWVRQCCNAYSIQGVHIRQIRNHAEGDWDISYNVSALKLETNIRAFQITKSRTQNEATVGFSNGDHATFSGFQTLSSILNTKLRNQSVEIRSQIWSSLGQMTSLLEGLQVNHEQRVRARAQGICEGRAVRAGAAAASVPQHPQGVQRAL
jgi:hypothetical protein